jgi:hypothetical protein
MYRPLSTIRLGTGRSSARDECGTTPFVLVEGLYALHQRLRDTYQFKIWMDVCRDARIPRVQTRDGAKLLRLWQDLYVPREWAYFRQQKPFECANVFILGPDLEWFTTRGCFSREAYGTSRGPLNVF